MALEIKKDKKPEPELADRTLYLSKDKNAIVEEGDSDAGFLLVTAGNPITDDAKEHMARLGIDALPDAPKATAADGADEDEEEVEEDEHDPDNPEAPPKKVKRRRKKAK